MASGLKILPYIKRNTFLLHAVKRKIRIFAGEKLSLYIIEEELAQNEE